MSGAIKFLENLQKNTYSRMSMTPQETERFLEWLSHNQEAIASAFPNDWQTR